MVKRRARAAGLSERICYHNFRATGITAHLENGGTFEKAQQIVAHERRRPSFMTAPATKWTSVRSSGLGFESYRVTGESFGGPGRLKQDRHAGPLGCNGWFK